MQAKALADANHFVPAYAGFIARTHLDDNKEE